MKYIIKILVNKANVFSSCGHTIDLEMAESLRWINGSFISSQQRTTCLRFEGLFFFWRAVYDSAVTGADNDQLWASLTALLGDLIGTLKDLIMTLYRCHLCHLWGLPVGLPRYTGPDNLAMVILWLGTSEPPGWEERERGEVDSQA